MVFFVACSNSKILDLNLNRAFTHHLKKLLDVHLGLIKNEEKKED